MRVAVFDSGIGGLTVVKSLINNRLFSEIIYYGDTARVPYGSKDKNTIIRYSLEALEFFNNFDVDLLIVACNTVSAYALAELQSKASYPVLGVIESGVMSLKNQNISKNSEILVIGTKATVESRSYQEALKAEGYGSVFAVATPLLVPLVEEGIVQGRIVDEVFDHYFGKLKKPDAVILGCTHYPMMSEALGEYFGEAKLVHSGEAIVEWLKINDKIQSGANGTELRLFASENVQNLKSVASRWLGDLSVFAQ